MVKIYVNNFDLNDTGIASLMFISVYCFISFLCDLNVIYIGMYTIICFNKCYITPVPK